MARSIAGAKVMKPVNLRPFVSEDIDWLVDRHATLYARDEGFDDTFGVLVRSVLESFVAEHDPERERGWVAERGGTRLGSIFCVSKSQEAAQLRLFLLVPEARGLGLGKRLLAACMQFARDAGYLEMVLWTHESHTAACALYRTTGWQLVASKPVHSFGQDLIEQSWRIDL